MPHDTQQTGARKPAMHHTPSTGRRSAHLHGDQRVLGGPDDLRPRPRARQPRRHAREAHALRGGAVIDAAAGPQAAEAAPASGRRAAGSARAALRAIDARRSGSNCSAVCRHAQGHRCLLPPTVKRHRSIPPPNWTQHAQGQHAEIATSPISTPWQAGMQAVSKLLQTTSPVSG